MKPCVTVCCHFACLQAAELKRFCMDFILRHSKEVELDSLSCEPQLLLEITRVLMSRQKAA